MVNNKKRVAVVAAHPDDEVLGAGGAILKHAQRGDEVFCLILGEGVTARSESSKSEVALLKREAIAVSRFLGFKKIFFSKFPDNSFDSINLLKIVKAVEKFLQEVKPDILYTHYEEDLNIDHRLTFQAVLTASRPCNENRPAEIYSFEVLSSSEWQVSTKRFKPNVFIDIESEIDGKIEAMKKYASEIKTYPHPRSLDGIKILAQYRGMEVGYKYAEAFQLVRMIK